MSETVVFFLSHLWSSKSAEQFLKLYRETPAGWRCFLLLQNDQNSVVESWREWLLDNQISDALIVFDVETLPVQLGFDFYNRESIVPGSAHFPVIYASQQQKFECCWVVEFDVVYTGVWSEFFKAYDSNESDLLVSHLQSYTECPRWHWWAGLESPLSTWDTEIQGVKGFFPIYRISRKAILKVVEAHSTGWSGHYEALVPSVLASEDMKVQDLAESLPECYLGSEQDIKISITNMSTMRWRPAVTVFEMERRTEKPCLFHPVK